MDTNKLSLVTNEYDDGVVCFGPVTESQLNRYNKLPRRTVLPSDLELSQTIFEPNEDKENDQSTVFGSNENTTLADNSIIITQSTNNFGEEKEEIGTMELKQSISEDPNLQFSSPCFSKCIPNAKLIDTEVINRYIRMGSISSDESSFSEDQNKSTLEDATISFTDAQEAELTQNDYVYNETSSCEHLSVSSVIDQSASINQQNLLDNSNNICTLIHCSQKDDTDLSICSDLEDGLGDVSEDSIVADEYSITPGKQRLFDLRVTKQSFRAKTLVASAPFMDRIEETTTPVLPKVLNSPIILNDISNRHSETKKSSDVLSITEIHHGSSAEHFNQTSNVIDAPEKSFNDTFKNNEVTEKLNDIISVDKSLDTTFDETINTNKLSTDMSMNIKSNQIESNIKYLFDNKQSINIVSSIAEPTSDVDNYNDEEQLINMEVNVKSSNTSTVNTILDDTVCSNKCSTNSRIMNFNNSLNETDHIESTLNNTSPKFDNNKTMKIMSNIAIPTSDVNNHNDEENSIATADDIKSINISVVDYTLNESTKHKFDIGKSINIISNIAEPKSYVDGHNDEEHSIAMEVDIKSTDTSIVDKIFDEKVCADKLSTNSKSIDLNKPFNDTEHKFDIEKSINIIGNIAESSSDVDDYNDEEHSITMEVDIKSNNSSAINKILDDTMCSDKCPTNNKIIDFNNSLNEIEPKLENDTSMNIMSNIAIPTSDVNDHNDEENSIATTDDIKTVNISVVDKSINIISNMAEQPTSNVDIDNHNDEEHSITMEDDIKSTITSIVDKIFDETMYCNKLSTNSKSIDLDKSSNEKILNNTEHKFDDKQSVDIIFNIAEPISDGDSHNFDEEHSTSMEVNIKSTDTNIVDKIFDETVYADKLSTNNKSIDLNKPFDDNEKSMNIISNIAESTSDIDDYNDEEQSINMEVNVKSSNTSAVNEILDNTMCSNEGSTNYKIMDFHKSLNETDHIESTFNDTYQFDNEKSMNIMSNIAIPTSNFNDHNDKKNLIKTEVDTKSINIIVVDKTFDDTMLSRKCSTNSKIIDFNKSLNETKSRLDDTEHRFVDNIQNITVPAIHFDDNVHLRKLDKSILKNTINSDNTFVENNEVDITCNTSLEDPSCMMRQYLDFEQAVNEMCNNITSASCPIEKIDKPKDSYDDETLEHLIEQTLSSDTFNQTKANENFSNYGGSNLSVIIENKTLETSSEEQNEDFENPNHSIPITLKSESIVNEIQDGEMLNKSIALNKSEPIVNGTDVNIQTETNANESISMNCTILDSGLVENINETRHYESSMFSDEVSKMEFDTFIKVDGKLNNITRKQILVPKDISEILSNQNTLEDNNINPISNQINLTDIPNFTAFKCIPETENIHKNLIDQDELLNNDNQQQDFLDTTKSNDNSLEEYKNLEQMFNFGDNQKETQMEYMSPKTQKLLDFSIVQQTPTFDNQAKKQKLLNFSIVDQTPIIKSVQQTYLNKSVINNESLINFSAVDQIWNSEVVSGNETNFKDFQNSSNNFSSNNLSKMSPPNVELLADESIKTNTSNFSNSTFNQTITDSNLNLSFNSCANNKSQNNVEPLVNKQIVVEPRNSLNQANEQIDNLKQTTSSNEPIQKTLCDEHCMEEASTKKEKLLSNTTLNKNNDSIENSNQELCLNSNKRGIVDFSIIDQSILENFELKTNAKITSVKSDKNISNPMEMSLVSIPVSENPLTSIISDNTSETFINGSADEINNTTLHIEESPFLHNNTDLLTDIQMNDQSLLPESPEKSSIIDSFHSIELDHVQEDNKRKIETTQDYDNNEKKMKVENEILKTPMSMLYKIKNMFRSSEKQPSCLNNTKENNFRSGKCYQQLNFGKFEENNADFTKPMSLKKPEVLTKSKIPCKVTDRSLTKNEEINNTSLSSLNDSIKQKKTIPKYSGLPVLSDVSNSSIRKCTESRIPSKFQK